MVKCVSGYNNQYLIYPNGKVYSKKQICWNGVKHWVKKGRYLKIQIAINGYKVVGLSKKGITKLEYLHRLIAKSFIPNPDNKKTVNHKDGNKLNNNLCNLEWATYSENTKHAFYTGLMIGKKSFGENNHQSKVKEKQIAEIRILKNIKLLKETAKLYNLSISQIWSIQNNVSWRHIKV